MGLHTKSQSASGRKEEESSEPSEGSESPEKSTFYRSGYIRFLVESKAVHDALEAAISDYGYSDLEGTGLERAANLGEDLHWLATSCGDDVPEPLLDGPGLHYASLLTQLARDDPARFVCHYYNLQFAHASGGRMIGKMVSNSLFDGTSFRFYKYDSGLKSSLDCARAAIDAIGNRWFDESAVQRCLDETPTAFDYGGTLLKFITQPEGDEAAQLANAEAEAEDSADMPAATATVAAATA